MDLNIILCERTFHSDHLNNIIEIDPVYLEILAIKQYIFHHSVVILILFCYVALGNYYSGIRLINPRLINPAAYYIQFAWNGIVPILSRYKNFG